MLGQITLFAMGKYFSNSTTNGESKIVLNENGEILTENIKVTKTFNLYVELVTDSLELFHWSLWSNISYDKVQNLKI